MFVPGTGASAAPAAPIAPMEALASSGVSSTPSPLGAPPMRERLRIHSQTLNVLAGHAMSVTGSLRPHLRGAKVTLDLLLGRRWVPVGHARTGARGRFALRYVPHGTGSWLAQVRYRGGPATDTVTRRLGVLSAFRPADASWYGGGGGLACGGELTSSTMGVANKTLPCGTWLTIRYGDRSVRVQVVDRGPYVAGREFDLTEATKRALGFEGVGVVWSTR
jgi:rare lipoprotein A